MDEFIPTVPDHALPLLDNRNPVRFTRRQDEGSQLGRVFHQKRGPGSGRPHPTDFYVEFPSGSGRFWETNANALMRALGHQPGRNPITRWSKDTVALLFAHAPPHVAVEDLLSASRSFA